MVGVMFFFGLVIDVFCIILVWVHASSAYCTLACGLMPWVLPAPYFQCLRCLSLALLELRPLLWTRCSKVLKCIVDCMVGWFQKKLIDLFMCVVYNRYRTVEPARFGRCTIQVEYECEYVQRGRCWWAPKDCPP